MRNGATARGATGGRRENMAMATQTAPSPAPATVRPAECPPHRLPVEAAAVPAIARPVARPCADVAADETVGYVRIEITAVER